MSKAKAKGTAFETKVKNVINDWCGEKVCERVALHGNADHGDLRILVDDLTLTGECKYRKAMPTEAELTDFKAQTLTENENAEQDGSLLFVNVPNRSIERAQVHMPMSTLVSLYGADRIIERVPEDQREKLRISLMVQGEHDWVCKTLLDFLYIAYGRPAWGR